MARKPLAIGLRFSMTIRIRLAELAAVSMENSFADVKKLKTVQKLMNAMFLRSMAPPKALRFNKCKPATHTRAWLTRLALTSFASAHHMANSICRVKHT